MRTQASMLGYHELMFPLAQTLRNIITHQAAVGICRVVLQAPHESRRKIQLLR